jgi:hypothetical protein
MYSSIANFRYIRRAAAFLRLAMLRGPGGLFGASPMEIEYHPIPKNPRFVNLIGRTFGRLTVIAYAGRPARRTLWFCQCIEGNIIRARGDSLLDGNTASCGCLVYENVGQFIHGKSGTPEHICWEGIRQRCCNRKHKSWSNYGGRGIKVCEGMQTFSGFYAIVGDRPSPMHEIDRINTNGNYSCGVCPECLQNGWTANCHWVTSQENNRNRRNNTTLTCNDETHCLAEWTEITGKRRDTIMDRIRRGWSEERAISEPIHAQHRKKDA